MAIPSVAEPTQGPTPLGTTARRSLTLRWRCGGLRPENKNVDYYAGHAEYGEGEGNAVVMAHLDVVPAGEGWSTDPFTMVLDDNHAYGGA